MGQQVVRVQKQQYVSSPYSRHMMINNANAGIFTAANLTLNEVRTFASNYFLNTHLLLIQLAVTVNCKKYDKPSRQHDMSKLLTETVSAIQTAPVTCQPHSTIRTPTTQQHHPLDKQHSAKTQQLCFIDVIVMTLQLDHSQTYRTLLQKHI